MDYDAIIVLAGGIKENGDLPDSVTKRINKAKDLFDQKLAPRIIMSGRWSLLIEYIPPKTEAESMVEYAQTIGIPKNVIIKEERSNDTISNAFYIRKLFLEPNKWKKVIVVTSDFHIPRTQYIFNKFLGPDYKIKYVSAKTGFDIKQWFTRRINERIFLGMTKKYFGKFEDGNIRGLENLFKILTNSEEHPFYSLVEMLTVEQK